MTLLCILFVEKLTDMPRKLRYRSFNKLFMQHSYLGFPTCHAESYF